MLIYNWTSVGKRADFTVYLIGYHRFTDFQSTLPVVAKRSHHPPLHVMPCGYREGRFAVCLSWYFIAENKIKQFAYSISQSARLTALFTKESRLCGLLKLLIYSGKTVQIIWNKATNGRPYGVSMIYFCWLQVDASYLCRLSLFFTTQLYHKKMTASVSFQSSCSHLF